MDTLYYFAYGSNMSASRLQSRIKIKADVGAAYLEGWQMVFNKRGRDGSGKANLIANPDFVTWGVLYLLEGSELDRLDVIEGGYERMNVRVRQRDGTVYDAVTYVSQDLTDDPRPSHEYKEYVLSGAREHHLPPDYLAYLEAFSVR